MNVRFKVGVLILALLLCSPTPAPIPDKCCVPAHEAPPSSGCVTECLSSVTCQGTACGRAVQGDCFTNCATTPCECVISGTTNVVKFEYQCTEVACTLQGGGQGERCKWTITLQQCGFESKQECSGSECSGDG